jgi:transposase
MQDKRRWLPGWQRVELVELCLDRGLTRRQAAAWRRVSVSTVQYWIRRYRAATEAERGNDRGDERASRSVRSLAISTRRCSVSR